MWNRGIAALVFLFGAASSPLIAAILFAAFAIWRIVSRKFNLSYWSPFLLTVVVGPLLLNDATLVLSVAALWVMWGDQESRTHGVLWAAPWIGMVMLWSLLYWWNSVELLTVQYSHSLNNTWGKALQFASPDFYASVVELSRVVLFVLMVSVGTARWREILRGAPVAMCGVIVAALMQRQGYLLSSLDPFWISLNRISASFSDPNAFGIGVFILLVFCIAHYIERSDSSPQYVIGKKRLLQIIILLGFLVTLWSGSRTFILGVTICSVAFMGRSVWETKKVVGFSVLLAVFLVFLFIIPGQYLPTAITRARALCVLGESNDSCSSRIQFTTISFQQFLDSPEIGLGPNSFERQVTHYAAKLGYHLGIWTDSGNNFYAQFLAEYGLIGVVALLLSFTRLSFRGEVSGETTSLSIKLLSAGAMTFFALLILGSHTDFAEITILAGILTGSVLIPRNIGIEPRAIPLGILSIPLIILGSLHVSYGLYPFEHEADGSYQRWLSPRARFSYECLPSPNKELSPAYLRNATPRVASVMIRELSTGLIKHLELQPGAEESLAVRQICAGGRLRITFEVSVQSPPWSPESSDASINADKRVLGVRLKGDPLVIG